jgi:nicotinamidase-related amidase
MDLSRAILVVVDMQNGFLNERSRHVIPAVVDLVAKWQSLNGATVFTRYFNYPGSPYERLIHWSKMQQPPETDITTELSPYVSNTIDKTIYSLFNDEGAEYIRQGGWQDLVFCAVATDGCVLKSATDAFERGLTPWVVRNACASDAGEAIHEAGLKLLARFIGRDQVVDSGVLFPRH